MDTEKRLLMSYTRMVECIESRAKKLLVFVRSFNTEEQEKSLLEDKLESVESMRSLFQETEIKLYGVIKEEEISDWQVTCEELEDVLDDIRSSIRRKLRMFDAKHDSRLSGEDIPISVTPRAQSRLPEIPLPRFSGQFEDWLYFKSQFSSMIEKREDLSDNEKLFYLRSSIQHGSAQHVQSIEDSFSSLWQALCNEFENKRLLVDKHIAQLFHLKPIVRESGSALRGMINEITRNTRALKNLDLNLDALSEQFVVHLVCTRLDSRTRKDFEIQLTNNTLPSLENLLEFLQSRCRCLENIEQDKKNLSSSECNARSKSNISDRNGNISKAYPVNTVSTNHNLGKVTCFMCKGSHFLNRCDNFLHLSPSDRLSKVKQIGICINCFSNKHMVSNCKASSCRKCGRRHHTMLHGPTSEPTITSSDIVSHPGSEMRQTPGPSTSRNNTISAVASFVPVRKQYILYTAIGLVEDAQGNSIKCRMLLDCGSMHNFVTPRIVNALRLKMRKTNVLVQGVSGGSQKINCEVGAKIRSISNPKRGFNLDFLVMKTITASLPVRSFPFEPNRIPHGMTLADPMFNQSRRIDMLLGIQVFQELFTGKSIPLSDDQSIWCKETLFGWVVGGEVCDFEERNPESIFCGVVTNELLSEQISKFWELETVPEQRKLTHDERAAEQNFENTCRRLENGRYEVGLPLKENIHALGDSDAMALRRFVQLEKRLIHDETLRAEYHEFMSDYHEQGHMIRSDRINPNGYTIPHHAIFNPLSTTTKTRVVFDASAISSSGTSLNDHLLIGPVVQRKLIETILRFRIPKIAFTADIKQMFRQISIRAADRHYQQIYWRSQPNEPLEVYQLATVTYGTACAPYLATRTLEQLCIDERERFPLASNAGIDLYMDDLLSGANTIEDALVLQREFLNMMASGGFELYKWASNHPELLKSVPNADSQQVAFFKNEKTTRSLGLTWQPINDLILTKLHEIRFHSGPATKCSVYSDIAKLYDPLGLLGPLIFTAKIQLQKLWQLHLDWDETLSDHNSKEWHVFKTQLQQMGEISIPRCVFSTAKSYQVELHGFCDASELGYGACIYMRSIAEDCCSTTLLSSKSRIAPLKNVKPTIPRLELCGALILARLISNTANILNIPFSRIILWCDSTTTLSWIRTELTKLKTFVCNRVIEIQELTKPMEWRHVRTHDNPADKISRGLLPSEIRICSLWWSGPSFLSHDESYWPQKAQLLPADQLPETKSTALHLAVIDPPVSFSLIEKESNFRRMQRIMALVLRFIDHIRPNDRKSRRFGALTIPELNQSLMALISITQREAFPDELCRLENGKVIHRKSKLITLSVFLDQSRVTVLRVGGRIRHSILPSNQKFPMVLPSAHTFTTTLIRAFHEELLHAPPQLLLNTLRRRFWILHGRSTVRKVIRSCVTCFRANPIAMQQMMGDLPKARFEGIYPFTNTGVDFCGPIYIKQHNKRSTITYKAYVAVFVCFATKAIHLELVGHDSRRLHCDSSPFCLTERQMRKTIFRQRFELCRQ